MQRLTAAIGLAGAAATLAACGDASKTTSSSTSPRPSVSTDERGVLETIDALQTASRRGDGRTICRQLFTPSLVRSVEAAAKRRCAVEVSRRLFSPKTAISVGRTIKVTGDRATAVIREQNGNVSTLFLARQSGQWRIDRVQPQARQ